MKSLFDKTAATEITQRIEKLTSTTPAQWGKMNVGQMMAHCGIALELYFGQKTIKRPLIGILIGGIAKKQMLSNKPWAKNLPTAKELIPSANTDFENEKKQLLYWLNRFVQQGSALPPVPHPFFGKMTTNDWGLHQYKHLDHHLTQFGV
ncbi:DUF1569 domain-containing protein [Flavisolibacter tropicus]|uniref:DUF1569 domain-containing protein n=1 Tax=Flavisolibacter tropicus TaxID=1492898 RepID=A0A172TZ19_9BACT|nr:DUF1569 domain-containing protein [Flavisolibacter tropicus]ANE52349.1 hypothetical protein SY85_19535 [Flavisolibacter tropicus]